MPSTIYAPDQALEFLDETELAVDDMIQVMDRSSGRLVWVTLQDLSTYLSTI